MSCPGCGSTRVLFLSKHRAYVCGDCDIHFDSAACPVAADGSAQAITLSPALARASIALYQPQPLTIFLSYGHDGFTPVTRFLYKLLTARGHTVWFDEESLNVGCDWATEMRKGVDDAVKKGPKGRILFIMAEHGSRGFCVNELTRATEAKGNIFVMKLQDAEAPVTISSKNCLNFSDIFISVEPKTYPMGGLTEDKWQMLFDSPLFLPRMWCLVNMLELNVDDVSLGGQHYGPIVPAACKLTTTSSGGHVDEVVLPSKIFISCAPKYIPFAERLAADLAAHGHHVLFNAALVASPGAPNTPEYHAYVDSSIREAAARDPRFHPHGKCLLLMTPDAVSCNAHCDMEIMNCFNKGLRFVPLMVKSCEVPLYANRVQYLPCYRVVSGDSDPITIHDEHYGLASRKLLKSLARSDVPVQGKQARLQGLLRPVLNESEISAGLSGFEGRRWFINEYDAWVASPTGARLRWITASLGAGKTTLAAKLASEKASVVASHFFNPSNKSSLDIRQTVLTLAFQLCSRFPDMMDRILGYCDIDNSVMIKSPEELLELLIIDPLKGLSPDGGDCNVIVLDGFGSLADHGVQFGKLLASALPSFPPWLRFMVFSREYVQLSTLLAGFGIEAECFSKREECNADLRDYLHKKLRSFSSVPGDAVSPPPPDVSAATEAIVARAQKLFVYCREVVDSLQNRKFLLHETDKLPAGIDGLFMQAMERQFPDVARYKSVMQMVFEVMAAAYEAPSLDLLYDILSLDTAQREELHASLGSVVSVQSDVLVPFHSSFLSEWLTDRAKAGKFHADVVRGHWLLGEWSLRVVQSKVNPLPRYVLKHAFEHLHASRNPGIALLQSDPEFAKQKRLVDLQDQGANSFYYGELSRDNAEKLLFGKPPGTFLIRYSERMRTYCVSFNNRVEGGLIMAHYLLYAVELLDGRKGFSEKTSDQCRPGDHVYASLQEFVEEYQRRGILTDWVPNTMFARA